MHHSTDFGFFEKLRNDIPASIIVFLVAVPLCLGIALASGAPLFSGIIAGIVGGIVVGLASGSALGVSGPAAGLAVIVLGAIQDLGFEAFLLAVMFSGLIQIVLGFARAGIIGYYFPSSVIKGMLAGIGVIIFLKQIPHAFGYDKDYEGSFKFAQPDGHNTFSELYFMFEAISPGATIIAAISIAILILWEQPFMKQKKVFKLIQGPLVAVGAGIGLNILFQNIPSLALKPSQVVAIPVTDSIQGFIGLFSLPDFGQIGNPAVYVAALTIAVVASLETLLCLEATDKLDPYKRVTPANRELKAQGLGNFVSGLIGGLPVTQVIVRSSTNILSGGHTKASAVFHGFLLLFCVMAIPFALNLIPLASLAAILFLVGYKLARPSLFRQMYKLGWMQFFPFIVTILGLVFTDLLLGVAMGLVVAIFHILYTNYKQPYFFNPEKEHKSSDPIRLELAENVTFINKAGILRTLNQIPDHSSVIIDASRTVNIDQDVLEIIDDFQQSATFNDIKVEIIGLSSEGVQKVNPIKKFEEVVVNGNGNSQQNDKNDEKKEIVNI